MKSSQKAKFVITNDNQQLMEDFTVAIYCFFDDYMKIACPKVDKRQKMSSAQVLTTAVVSARYFGCNMVKARLYMREVFGFDFPHKSNFNRHLHRLSQTLNAIFLRWDEVSNK